MRKLPTILRCTLPFALGALALGGAACSRFTGSGDDSAPTAKPAMTATAAPAATATATSTLVAPGVYTVNKPLETDPNSTVTTVTIDAETTSVTFLFKNDAKEPSDLTLAKPGTREAMFLEQPDGKKISLRSSSGIGVKPANSTVKPGGTLQFTAVFGPLDPGVRKFSLYEGEAAKTAMPGDTTYWVVHDIEIK